ncbi:MAG: hypothetical protein HY582_00095, partial [Candidatus Omnitrophica bacterium]|nr:hypothetical protein [Candidatus Omnitrophota bacterium]
MIREELYDDNVEIADLKKAELLSETNFTNTFKKEKRLDLIAKLRAKIYQVLNPLIGQGI